MGNLIVQMQTSIDGFVSSDDPLSRWQLWDWGPQWPWSSDVRDQFNETIGTATAILLSRPIAAGGFLDHWRQVALAQTIDPDYAFAHQIGRLPKIIVTGQSATTHWPRTTVVEGDFAETIAQVKNATANMVCFGGTSFVAALLSAGLVDELQLYINPGIAGRGVSIFDHTLPATTIALRDATPTDCGIVIARWAPHAATR